MTTATGSMMTIISVRVLQSDDDESAPRDKNKHQKSLLNSTRFSPRLARPNLYILFRFKFWVTSRHTSIVLKFTKLGTYSGGADRLDTARIVFTIQSSREVGPRDGRLRRFAAKIINITQIFSLRRSVVAVARYLRETQSLVRRKNVLNF